MLNIGKLRVGAAEYYIGELAHSPEDYYLGHGEAAGRWVGSLATEMGLTGEVEPDHFRALLDGHHPLTGERLAIRQVKEARTSQADPDEWLTVGDAAGQLGVSDRFVRRLLKDGTMPGEKARSEATGRIGWRVRRVDVNDYAENHKPAKRRPGFDLTLRPPKSVSVLWALADPDRRAVIRQAHREAVDEVVRYYESQATMARYCGERIQTAGAVAAAFDHRTSRAGDPLLHTHVVVANLTVTVNDDWRALDGRLLYHHSLSGGYLYQAHLRHLLTDRLGLEWGPVDKGLADVIGVPREVIDAFSQRRNEIEEMLAESGYTSARARQAATLATRKPKDHHNVGPETLVARWRERADTIGFDHTAVEACFDRSLTVRRRPLDADRLMARLAGPHGLTVRASTFTRRDVVQRIASELVTAPAIEVERLADRFIASDQAVLLVAPHSGRDSDVVIGAGHRRIRTGGTALFSTPELVRIETELMRWATEERRSHAMVPSAIVDRALSSHPELSDEQASMVRFVCTSRATVQPVVGRPGSGKTHAAAVCVEALSAAGIPVVGCAVSATAAAELESSTGLRDRTGRPASTIAGLLVDLEQRADCFAPGTVVLVDEASMAGTRDLARLAGHIRSAGGSITLIGDPDQHDSVDVGGVFRSLASHDAGVVRLTANQRQLDPEERAAIDEYRTGEIADALDRYDQGGRLTRAASAQEAFDVLVRDWWADRQAGSNSPMLTGTNAARRALNARARALLKSQGRLTGTPLVVGDREFMVGDEVVARRNDRHLRSPDGSHFVKNGSSGVVVEIDHVAGEIVAAFDKEGSITIPRAYLDDGHLEHGYARTTYGVQGATLDRARYLPTDASRFEEGYVAITRATEQTNLYVVEGDVELDDETDHGAVDTPETGLDTITEALARRSDQRLATEIDPLATHANELAENHTLAQLRQRRTQLDEILRHRPPSVADDLETERAELARLLARREQLFEQRASWHPGRRRSAGRALANLDGRIDEAEARVAELGRAQAKHEMFDVEHADQLAESGAVRRATQNRRLKVGVEAVADPSEAILSVLGPRPTAQRERLAWDQAAESIAVHLDETEWTPPAEPASIGDLLGPASADPWERLEYERVASAVAGVLDPSPCIEQGLGIV